MSKLNIPALKDFADAIKNDPSILFTPELAFLRTALSAYGTLKEPVKSKSSSNHDTGHDHGHAHAHGHDDCCGSSPAPKKVEPVVEEEEDDDDEPEEVDPERLPEDSGPFPEIPAGGEDWDKSGDLKEKANEAKSNGDYETAIAKFTESMSCGQVSAMTLANRAECLLKLKKPCAAISDCSAALGYSY